MKPIKFLTAPIALLCLVACFLPFWQGVSLFDFMSAKSWQAYLIVSASAVALLMSAFAIKARVMRRATALVVTAAFASVAVTTLIQFVPLFDDNPGAISDLFDSGDWGAKLLFCGGAAGFLLALIAVLKAERIAD